MKKFVAGIVLLTTLALAATALAQGAKPGDHPKKVYVDQATGRVYTPHGMELFLRLATSAEDAASSILLRNQASTEPSAPVHGFKLEGHGEHTVVHSQESWKSKVKHTPEPLDLFFIMDDARSPDTSVDITKAPQVVNGKRRVFGKPGVTFTFPAKDDGSGVEATYYSVDGAAYQQFRAGITFDTDREFDIARYSVDNVGNAEKPVLRLYSVDLTPPTTTHEITRNFYNNIVSPRATFRFDAKDVKAGVRRTFYAFDGGADQTYKRGSQVAVKELSEGDHVLSYHSDDRVENVEARNSFNFFLDATPPVTTIAIQGDKYESDRLYVSGRTRFELTATDNKAGVDQIKYLLTRRQSQIYLSPFGLPPTRTNYDIRYWATDRVGNSAEAKSLKVVLDIKPPKPELAFNGGHYFIRNIHYVTSQTMVTVEVTDDLSGVQTVEYSLDPGMGPKATTGQSMTAPFTITPEGEHTLVYFAIDNVNNRSEDHEADVIVDDTPPEIFNHYGGGKIEGDPGDPGSDGVYPPKSLLYLAATDSSSGVGDLRYSVNGGEMQKYASPIRFTKEGRYAIHVTSTDNVDNKSEKAFSFRIRKD